MFLSDSFSLRLLQSERERRGVDGTRQERTRQDLKGRDRNEEERMAQEGNDDTEKERSGEDMTGEDRK